MGRPGTIAPIRASCWPTATIPRPSATRHMAIPDLRCMGTPPRRTVRGSSSPYVHLDERTRRRIGALVRMRNEPKCANELNIEARWLLCVCRASTVVARSSARKPKWTSTERRSPGSLHRLYLQPSCRSIHCALRINKIEVDARRSQSTAPTTLTRSSACRHADARPVASHRAPQPAVRCSGTCSPTESVPNFAETKGVPRRQRHLCAGKPFGDRGSALRAHDSGRTISRR